MVLPAPFGPSSAVTVPAGDGEVDPVEHDLRLRAYDLRRPATSIAGPGLGWSCASPSMVVDVRVERRSGGARSALGSRPARRLLLYG